MKKSFAFVAVFATIIYKVRANAEIETTGVATSCGENTCCIPSCLLNWSDSNGCSGQAETTGSCSDAFTDSTSTQDTGVDICDGSGAFFCFTDGGVKAVYVVNRENEVSALLFPATYNECTLSGQCAGCPSQSSCQDAVSIGTSTTHSCSAFDALLTSSNVDLQPC